MKMNFIVMFWKALAISY